MHQKAVICFNTTSTHVLVITPALLVLEFASNTASTFTISLPSGVFFHPSLRFGFFSCLRKIVHHCCDGHSLSSKPFLLSPCMTFLRSHHIYHPPKRTSSAKPVPFMFGKVPPILKTSWITMDLDLSTLKVSTLLHMPKVVETALALWHVNNICVSVSNKHQLVNLYLLRVRPGWCTKGHKVYTGSGRVSLRLVHSCLCY